MLNFSESFLLFFKCFREASAALEDSPGWEECPARTTLRTNPKNKSTPLSTTSCWRSRRPPPSSKSERHSGKRPSRSTPTKVVIPRSSRLFPTPTKSSLTPRRGNFMMNMVRRAFRQVDPLEEEASTCSICSTARDQADPRRASQS